MLRAPSILLLSLVLAPAALADEGMWLVNEFPSAKVQAAHGFAPSQDWLDRVRLGAVRLANGCSASFVSSSGLVMTDHHCVRDCVQELSTPKDDYLERGFFAKSEKDERRCPKIEANQLVAITDVTDRVRAAVGGKEGEAFATALRQESAKIEGACATSPKVRCEVVNLFHGGKYHLYTYRRFQDVRLVFAPEFPMASFGGYADNFEFPRYGFDVGLLRVYEDGVPVSTPDALPWASTPAKEGDLVFVAGNPGGTERVQTIEQLAFQRDVALPWWMVWLGQLRGTLLQFAGSSPELYRITRGRIRTVENSLKALSGRQAWLADPANFERKRTEDAELRAAVRADPAKEGRFGPAWNGISEAVRASRSLFVRHEILESGMTSIADLFAYARVLVRAADERPKPSPERLKEYGDARLPVLETLMLRHVPISRTYEQVILTFALRNLRDTFGPDDPAVQVALGKESPEEVARAAVQGTHLDQVKVREQLWKGGAAAIAASKDPMILLARRIDGPARAVRTEYENKVEGALARNGELLFQAAVAVRGTSSYPDATFTLRISYGTISGWTEGGRQFPAMTRVAGLYARDTGKFPFAVAPTWLAARPKLDPEMPYDIATTNDIIGGNSGSPVINRAGEVVALIFDGNRGSLGGDYGYDAATNRAVAVHGQALLEGLAKVYGAGRLVEEIRTRGGAGGQGKSGAK